MGRARAKLNSERKGSFNIMLGGVTCTFKREIKPNEPFEIWTRVLSWDRKWLYLVSHIVKKEAVKPNGYTLQPWKKKGDDERRNEHAQKKPHPAILATSIAKYVFKQGRVTIPPERVLEASVLLPPKPPNMEQQLITGELLTAAASANRAPQSINLGLETPRMESKLETTARGTAETLEAEVWDWQRVEQERAQGMSIANYMAGLDALHDTFTADNRPALGQY